MKSIKESLILASTIKEDAPHSGIKQKLMAFGIIWSEPAENEIIATKWRHS